MKNFPAISGTYFPDISGFSRKLPETQDFALCITLCHLLLSTQNNFRGSGSGEERIKVFISRHRYPGAKMTQ